MRHGPFIEVTTVQRATTTPWRPSCRYTFHAGILVSLGCHNLLAK
jgi:hypothetical protein